MTPTQLITQLMTMLQGQPSPILQQPSPLARPPIPQQPLALPNADPTGNQPNSGNLVDPFAGGLGG